MLVQLLALAIGAAPADTVPLYRNLGQHHHAITTTSPLAQRYFDQGLRLVYAFNHAEAIAAFERAAELDSTCAICHWGAALALGPNINLPMDSVAGARAWTELRRAQALARHASPKERAYIAALARRYAPLPLADRAPLDSAYALAMARVSRAYPADLDAATLAAEAMLDLRPWHQWKPDGRPEPGTLQVVALLESVIKRAPHHPGACHYYIHTVEASRTPARALPCAERLARLMPGAGHLVHMPAHIYMRVGDYARAVEANRHAAHVDEAYIADRRPEGVYPVGYYGHNLHFLWHAAQMDGQSATALDAAQQVGRHVSPELVRRLPFMEQYVPTPIYALVRFGRWDELMGAERPPADLRFAAAMWRYGRGLALVHAGELDSARVQLDSLALPPDTSGAAPEPGGPGHVVRIARAVLRGAVAEAAGDTAAAIAALVEGVKLQDSLPYDEPPRWYYPVRESLGRTLLAAGRPAEAAWVFREDLRRNPKSARSLYGLSRALDAQGRSAAAKAIDARARAAWARADVPLEATILQAEAP